MRGYVVFVMYVYDVWMCGLCLFTCTDTVNLYMNSYTNKFFIHTSILKHIHTSILKHIHTNIFPAIIHTNIHPHIIKHHTNILFSHFLLRMLMVLLCYIIMYTFTSLHMRYSLDNIILLDLKLLLTGTFMHAHSTYMNILTIHTITLIFK